MSNDTNTRTDDAPIVDINDQIAVSFEAINLTGEGRRGHLRSKNNVTFVSPGYARYAAGVRFSF